MPDCRPSLVTIATLLILLSVPTTAQQTSPSPTSGLEYGVAIVPLTNITGHPDDAWIGSGIAETLAADLQSDPLFTVIGRESVQKAMAELSRMAAPDAGSDRETELLELGRRLGVRWVISGGYQRSGDQLRIPRLWSRSLPGRWFARPRSMETWLVSSICRTRCHAS